MHWLMLEADPAPDAPDLSDAINTTGLTAVDWIVATGLVLGGFLLAVVARRVVARIFRRGPSSTAHIENLISRLLQAGIVLLSLAYALGVVGVRISPLLGALGIGGLALALALQPTLQNLFSGLVIHAQRPLRVGEEIVTGEIQGKVIDVTSRAVVIRQNSGETVYIPNSIVVDREVINLVRHGRRRTTLVVGVAYETDLSEARSVILEAVSAVRGVLGDPAPRVLAREFADSSINFDVDFWHQANEARRREVRDRVVVRIHEALAEAAITIPFPQRTLWFGEEDDSAADEGPR